MPIINKPNMETSQAPKRPDLPHHYTVDNIVKVQKTVNIRVCQKTLNVAQKYLEGGETISTFNKSFMNELSRTDPEKLRQICLQENGMTMGVHTTALFDSALRYFAQSDEEGFNAKMLEIEHVTKRVMDIVFRGNCSLAEIDKARQILVDNQWVEVKQPSFTDKTM